MMMMVIMMLIVIGNIQVTSTDQYGDLKESLSNVSVSVATTTSRRMETPSSSLFPTIGPTPGPSIFDYEHDNVTSMSPTTDFQKNSSTPSRSSASSYSILHESYQSQAPSGFPSDVPSMVPTTSKRFPVSQSPSSSPTQDCHDDASYTSPINDQKLTCLHHKDTNCLDWRHLGLTKLQLQELLEACRRTCQFDCTSSQSFVSFDIPVSLRIKNVPGYMGESTKGHFEEATQRYLQQSMISFLKTDGGITILDDNDEASSLVLELDRVDLISQILLEPTDNEVPVGLQQEQQKNDDQKDQSDVPGERRNEREKHRRYLQRRQRNTAKDFPSVTGVHEELLEVTIVLDGFSIGLAAHQVSELALLVIQDLDYMKLLKRYDVYFATADILSVGEAPTSDNPDQHTNNLLDSDPSQATVIVSLLVSISMFVFLIGSIIYHRRTVYKLMAGQIETQIGGDAVVVEDDRSVTNKNNSMHGLESDGTIIAGPIRMSSHENDSSKEAETKSMRNLLEILMATISQQSRQSSTRPVMGSQEDGTSTWDKIAVDRNKKTDGDRVDSTSTMKSSMGQIHERASKVHADFFSTAIPEMIVYNIEEEEEDDGRSDNNEDVVSKTAMKRNKVINDLEALKSRMGETLRSGDSNSVSETCSTLRIMNASPKRHRSNRSSSSFSKGNSDGSVQYGVRVESDSDDDEDMSVASTPVHSRTPKARSSVRRSSSFDADKMTPIRFKLLTSDGVDSVGPVVNMSHSASERGCGSSTLKLRDSTGSRSTGQSSSRPSGHVDYRALRPPMHPPDKERHRQTSRSTSPATGVRDRTHMRSSAMLTLSPITKVLKESVTSHSLKRSLVSWTGNIEVSAHSRQPSSLSDISGDLQVFAGSRSTRSDSSASEAQILELEAPRRGQLGLVIESKSKRGPSVYAVKDYSPLFGQIYPGDRIVEIDGKDTSQSELTDIAKILIKSKKGSSFKISGGSGHGGTMRIVVSRPNKVQEIPLHFRSTRQDTNTLASDCSSHQRDNSYGSDVSSRTADYAGGSRHDHDAGYETIESMIV
jgi:hypothetical protein